MMEEVSTRGNEPTQKRKSANELSARVIFFHSSSCLFVRSTALRTPRLQRGCMHSSDPRQAAIRNARGVVTCLTMHWYNAMIRIPTCGIEQWKLSRPSESSAGVMILRKQAGYFSA